MYTYNCSGARISVGDGTLTILAKNQAVMEKVQEKVYVPFWICARRATLWLVWKETNL